jgi:hypothetical protein
MDKSVRHDSKMNLRVVARAELVEVWLY